MPEISAGWGPPVTLGASRPAGEAATSRFATGYRPLPDGRGFFMSTVSQEEEDASDAGAGRNLF